MEWKIWGGAIGRPLAAPSPHAFVDLYQGGRMEFSDSGADSVPKVFDQKLYGLRFSSNLRFLGRTSLLTNFPSWFDAFQEFFENF